MNITVIGAGFAGLASAYFLAQAHHKVTVISSPQETGASAIAAGLVHSFTGAQSKLNHRGLEAFAAAEQLFLAVQAAAKIPFILHRGLFRLALDEQQTSDFQKNALQFPNNEWRNSHAIPGAAQAPGLWIPSAYTIHSTNYIAALTQECIRMGVEFQKRHLTALPEAPVIIAAGRSISTFFPETQFTYIKGHLLRLSWPPGLPPLPHALNSKAYIVMDQDQQSCWIGSTFEREFASDKPDKTTAVQEIMPKAIDMIPSFEKSELLDCQAGVRVSTPNHLPLIKEMRPGCWAVTGMGSKGLLYHALLGKELAGYFNL